jgi:hypothetical protein
MEAKDMPEMPSRLQCAFCQRNHRHGGECYRDKFDDTGCLAFLPDPKGCIRNGDARLHIPLYYKFPPLSTWCSDWTMNGVDTEISIRHIKGLDWDVKKGYLIVYCNYDYYINEYHEDYQSPKNKPVLKVVK